LKIASSIIGFAEWFNNWRSQLKRSYLKLFRLLTRVLSILHVNKNVIVFINKNFSI